MSLNFDEMNLSPETLRAIKDMGFTEATPIQSQTIELVKSGRDVIGQSGTGTGKTAAFGIPCLEMIDPDNPQLQAVILSPTRELAMQICEELRRLLKYRDNIKVLPVYGGQPIVKQIAALRRGVQIVVGTPGRVLDHISRHTLKLGSVSCAILDEADEMLDMGFRDDIEKILSKMPEDRQTVMFSATMPEEIKQLANTYQKNPEFIRVGKKELTVPKITQTYFEMKERTKPEAISRLLAMYKPELTIVFCNTKKRVDDLVGILQSKGYIAEGLHGDLKQTQRDVVMNKFRSRTLEILVATDVAARGIDVDDVSMVINYDIPQEAEYYVHRIGRTGRAGKEGKAFSFVVGRDIYRLRDIMRYAKCKIKLGTLPSLTDIEKSRTDEFMDSIRTTIADKELTKYKEIVARLMDEDYHSVDIAAALFKMALSKNDADEALEEIASDPDAMVQLEINAGSKKSIRIKDIVGAIAGECGIPGKTLGQIKVYDDYSLVEVPGSCAADILKIMQDKKLKKTRITIKLV
jgi:ATP-dependent RNA helicase DeaD